MTGARARTVLSPSIWSTSFLWKRINGERTVGQLAQQLKEQFGDQAEPLYDRLVKYMQILRNNEFILFRGKDKVKE